MPALRDGPFSPLFSPVPLSGTCKFEDLRHRSLSGQLGNALQHAPEGDCVAWGIPFKVNGPLLIRDRPVEWDITPTAARWFIFLHTSDVRPDEIGTVSLQNTVALGALEAVYVFCFEDGTEERVEIRRRHQIGPVHPFYGEGCTEAVPARKPRPAPQDSDKGTLRDSWGYRQTRAYSGDRGPWNNYLWAFENPQPQKPITRLRFEPRGGAILVSGVSTADTASNPLIWNTRQKAVITLPVDNSEEIEKSVQLDLGQVISLRPHLIYPDTEWSSSRQNLQPVRAPNEVLVEYSAHPEASFHLRDGSKIRVPQSADEMSVAGWSIRSVDPAVQRVKLRVVESQTRTAIPAKLHFHGRSGEYLAPLDRHRVPNARWFEDLGSASLCHGDHTCTYIPGQTVIDLPLGQVYVEVTKGFEVKPVRTIINITGTTEDVVIELDKVLLWREKGWVTADTHVHFLSPTTAMLEGAAEGVNVINLLASQWGELMTNVGDFDGRSTFGSRAAGGDGEYIVRVGSENRQHILGHISLLGYEGSIIMPLCSGGPHESAIGDPVDVLLTEWAKQCRAQGGLVILPHFPHPRLENAATIVAGEAHAVEMCSNDDFYGGINPYSLLDWYRFLNNGYLVAAVGGTDKMSARDAVGTVRTYAYVGPDLEFTFQSWAAAVRSARTFVTFGPLVEFEVDGRPMGAALHMSASGGSVDVTWRVASVVIPMTRVDLIVNGTIRETRTVKADEDQGSWSIKINKSAWIALLVRAKYNDKPEMIAAHTSPVMIHVEGSQFFAAADALTILEQIEGTMAYIDSIGTRADSVRRKQMRLVLESAYRRLHNRFHEAGLDHHHSPGTHHS
ncbi:MULTISPECIES: CehA/McbA family metallohydrolase [Bradyrhizobium]|uniref:CehA/McbA family metallohydrolase n=1 Tax=Bradyrhizobium centrosematis TaxID=1300039 RepID=UPI002166E64B|nr:CehA/McbA family metallohydrolase [Bradyrhizobium centrosematis]MCS3765882.1 hypothetical protein [Bradyrhizobium centrosematis]MCS3778216.1 hypothetical protein [Bradyrhizobium centrosematis]